ncbi:hypothetical protein [Salipiger aestuarii]|uniref:Transferrin-binding protein B C-lobe/N-lobe beta barrel domain-containing protein n=1 Tax=Salipiger aestuarii TaxID=568098 RepID=A0A327YEQ8_9RHOB|nr:hypothetical protein [Salipiger aestuarii]RAK16979.1 hypothetical protein ATI53_101766 [Salipiger aestuarii]
MITRFAIALAILGALSACNGNTSSGDDESTDEDTVEEPDSFPLPGSRVNPTASQSITRMEVDDGAGNGMIVDPTYDPDTDTFYVDNLAFDGANTYARADFSPLAEITGALGPFAVYENADTVTDPVNGDVIPQLQHKAIYAVSQSGQTELAIVRTGAFVDYGFGGFVYQRNGGVTIPTSGQASYSGSYGGLRDYQGTGKIEYSTADAQVYIDFEDYNEGDGVRGAITDRRIYDSNGVDISTDYVNIPTIQFEIGPGVARSNGEMSGTAFSMVDGATHETGSFYAVLSDGADNDVTAEEIVGIIVIEGTVGDTLARETGGFMVTR